MLGASRRENALDLGSQPRLAPVIPSRFLGSAGITVPRSLEDRTRGRRVECRIRSRRKNESAT
jgi:hypothetical protein